MPETFFASFGVGQYGGLLHDKFVEIVAENEFEARALMLGAFGTIWAELYEDDREFWDTVIKFRWEKLGTLEQTRRKGG
jgi:hypothetical protein